MDEFADALDEAVFRSNWASVLYEISRQYGDQTDPDDEIDELLATAAQWESKR